MMNSEKPLILLKEKSILDKRENKRSGFRNISFPTYAKQKERIVPKLERLSSVWTKNNAIFTNDPSAIDIEYAIVMETVGDVESFYTVVKTLNKTFEFDLFDDRKDKINSDSDFYYTDDSNKTDILSGKVFCVLADHLAVKQLISLWSDYCKNEKMDFPHGLAGLKHVFKQLKDLRLWSEKDRYEETGIKAYWEEQLSSDVESIKCEIELFYPKNEEVRKKKRTAVEQIIKSLNGEILSQCVISEIKYNALLVSLPRISVSNIINNIDISLIKCDGIMYIKPQSLAVININDNDDDNDKLEINEDVISYEEEPVIALFDGMPQENHELLKDLLIVDDPDNFSENCVAKGRNHGTSMASLILRNDLNSSFTPSRKIYARPVLITKHNNIMNKYEEVCPDNCLFVDLIHRCIIRLFEEDAGRVSPNIKIINFSIGIAEHMFYFTISPLAKLLDWLSYKYKVLFIISAGNHNLDMDLEMPFAEFKKLSIEEKSQLILKFEKENTRNLRLLSPAESINGITVGALYSDSCLNLNPLPFQTEAAVSYIPSPISSLGSGINNSVKPDIFVSGGRKFLRNGLSENDIIWCYGDKEPGIKTASPYTATEERNYHYIWGTSASTAIVTHYAGRLYDIIKAIFVQNSTEDFNKYAAVLVKAMLVHGAKWDEKFYDILNSTIGVSGRGANEIHKWIGYGVPDFNRVIECTNRRITFVGYGELQREEAHSFKFPIPVDLHNSKIKRNTTITLSYLTSISTGNQKYRDAQVWFSIDEEGQKMIGKRDNVDDKVGNRGTLQHETYMSDSIIVWDETHNDFEIKVNCTDCAFKFKEPIPYAIFITIEFSVADDVDIYSKIINKLNNRVETKEKIIV